MTNPPSYSLRLIGFIHSNFKDRNEAPRQGEEGAPDAWLGQWLITHEHNSVPFDSKSGTAVISASPN
jgi:hypothetical protein